MFVGSDAEASEAELQELSAAGGVAIHQGAKADLMGDAGAGDRFSDDADHDAEQGGAAVEQFSSLGLLLMDQFFSAVLKPPVVGWSVGHGTSEMKEGW